MNLSDMLSYADIGQLSKIAGAYRCECNGNSKNELIQSILSQMNRHDVFEKQISSMTMENLRFLNSLLFDTRQAYSLEDLVARVQHCRFADEKKEQAAAPKRDQSGNTARSEEVGQSGNTARSEEVGQSGNTAIRGNIEQTGNTARNGDVDQLGNTAIRGNIEQIANTANTAKSGNVADQSGNTARSGNVNQLGISARTVNAVDQIGNAARSAIADHSASAGKSVKSGKAGNTAKPKSSRKKRTTPPEPPSPRDIIVHFKHQGWLFNGFSGPSRYLFQVPSDLKSRFRETMRKRFTEQLQYTDEPVMYRDEQGLLNEDIKQLLQYVYHNEVQLVSDGTMYKRSLLQLLDRMGVKEELPSKGAWRFGYGRHFNHYPDRFSLIYDYCCSSGYLSEQIDGWLKITSAGQERMTQAVDPSEQKEVYRYWLKLYKGPVSNLHSIVHWVHALAPDWVTAASLRDSLTPFIKTYYYDDATTILESRVLKMMMHLGLLRIGEHTANGAVVRMTASGNAMIGGAQQGVDEKDLLRH